MYSMGMLIYAIYNHGRALFENRNNLLSYKSNVEQVSDKLHYYECSNSLGIGYTGIQLSTKKIFGYTINDIDILFLDVYFIHTYYMRSKMVYWNIHLVYHMHVRTSHKFFYTMN